MFGSRIIGLHNPLTRLLIFVCALFVGLAAGFWYPHLELRQNGITLPPPFPAETFGVLEKRAHHIPDEYKNQRPGQWLPADYRVHHARQVAHVDARAAAAAAAPLILVLQEFKAFIEGNPRMYMYFTQMWNEIPRTPRYATEPTGAPQIRDYVHMLDVLNHILTQAPGWTDAAAGVGMVGVPILALFDYVMGTPIGHAAFLDPDVNKMLKKVLNEWGKFLLTPESAAVLGDGKEGWFCDAANKDIMQMANAPLQTDFKFEDMFVCDPNKTHHGYTSWDDETFNTYLAN